jgi:hypothetical protein
MKFKHFQKEGRNFIFYVLLLTVGMVFSSVSAASAQDVNALQQRITQLENELSATRAQLKRARQVQMTDTDEPSDKIQFGPFTIGGAIRANYVIGDYEVSGSGDGPSRGGHGGNFELDTFRINIDYDYEDWLGKLEYRFYDGYNFMHTAWVGYDFEDDSQLQMGINRVPFGPGAYGVSQSWFFDQHYYVGLSDDMDLGFKYQKPMGDWNLDLAYYVVDEGHWRGSTEDSARYSYDVVDESGSGYEEENQINARAIYSFSDWEIPTDVGASVQYGLLDSNGPQDDGDHWASSVHMVNQWENWKLATQFTYYKYNLEDYAVQSGVTTDKLIDMGAYNYAYPVAAEAMIPAVSLSYHLDTPDIGWLDYIVPYTEYSSIIKEESSFNDSDLVTAGIAWASGNWYCYTEWATSNGNYFVGNDSFTEFGANPNNDWQSRFNINFGYYF